VLLFLQFERTVFLHMDFLGPNCPLNSSVCRLSYRLPYVSETIFVCGNKVITDFLDNLSLTCEFCMKAKTTVDSTYWSQLCIRGPVSEEILAFISHSPFPSPPYSMLHPTITCFNMKVKLKANNIDIFIETEWYCYRLSLTY